MRFNVNILIFIAVIIIFVIKGIRNVLKKVEGNGIQDKLQHFFDNLADNNTVDNTGGGSQRTVIYDENGNEINSENSFFPEDFNRFGGQEDIVIYDENGNIISSAAQKTPPPPPPPPVRKEEDTVSTTANAVKYREEEEEPAAADAEMYRDFIQENGSASIVVREIMDKPLALR